MSDINTIRKDYFLEKYTVFATARARRPDSFSQKAETSDSKKCPFCPHNEDQLVVICDNKKKWDFRLVKNKFGIFTPNGHPAWDEEGAAYGFSEVLIESQQHDKEFYEHTVKQLAHWLGMLGERQAELSREHGVRFVSIFKNRGRDAGASIAHGHSQIITAPQVPQHILELRIANQEYYNKHGTNLLLDVVDFERSTKRFVAENETAVVFAPYASILPLELWFVPKRHVTSPANLLLEECEGLAKLLKSALKQLDTLGPINYNLLFIYDNDYGTLQFHIRLIPRLQKLAGFELSTGYRVNTTLPEDAAQFYKKGV